MKQPLLKCLRCGAPINSNNRNTFSCIYCGKIYIINDKFTTITDLTSRASGLVRKGLKNTERYLVNKDLLSQSKIKLIKIYFKQNKKFLIIGASIFISIPIALNLLGKSSTDPSNSEIWPGELSPDPDIQVILSPSMTDACKNWAEKHENERKAAWDFNLVRVALHSKWEDGSLTESQFEQQYADSIYHDKVIDAEQQLHAAVVGILRRLGIADWQMYSRYHWSGVSDLRNKLDFSDEGIFDEGLPLNKYASMQTITDLRKLRRAICTFKESFRRNKRNHKLYKEYEELLSSGKLESSNLSSIVSGLVSDQTYWHKEVKEPYYEDVIRSMSNKEKENFKNAIKNSDFSSIIKIYTSTKNNPL